MAYFFPSPIDDFKAADAASPVEGITLQSGEAALQLLLRSAGLQPGARVATAAFVCEAVERAICSEGFTPLFLDLQDDGSYWSDYSPQKLQEGQVKAVVLIHLYGFLHPDTKLIQEFCQQQGMVLIHDTAQCYGVDVSTLQGAPWFYSFGPGKSSSAAHGALVCGIENHKSVEDLCTHKLLNGIIDKKSELFLQQRIYGRSVSTLAGLRIALLSRLENLLSRSEFYSMSEFQRRAASYAMQRVAAVADARKERHRLLAAAITHHNDLAIAYNSGQGQYFKAVLRVRRQVEKFIRYLEANQVPYFQLVNRAFRAQQKFRALQNFQNQAGQFIELSTEATVPLPEIERIANLLQHYRL